MNRRTEARERLREGVELAQTLGAFGLAGRANQEIAATGARPRKVLQTGLDALTASERRVARARGRRDEQQGDRANSLRHDQDRRGAPEPRLPQARDQLPRSSTRPSDFPQRARRAAPALSLHAPASGRGRTLGARCPGSPPTRITASGRQSRCLRTGGRTHEAMQNYTETWCKAGGDWPRSPERRRSRPLPARRQRPTHRPDAYGAHAARPFPARHPADHRRVHGLRARLPGHGLVRRASSPAPATGTRATSRDRRSRRRARPLRPHAGGRVDGRDAGADRLRRPRRPRPRIGALNTYDFADGVKRASLFARLVAGSIEAPVVGPMVARLENGRILERVLRGGLQDPDTFPTTTSMSSVASASVPDTQQWPERYSATWTA